MKIPPAHPAKSPATIEQKAKVCATVAEDILEESRTGESGEKAANEAEARVWQQKSQALRDAAARISAGAPAPAPPVQD